MKIDNYLQNIIAETPQTSNILYKSFRHKVVNMVRFDMNEIMTHLTLYFHTDSWDMVSFLEIKQVIYTDKSNFKIFELKILLPLFNKRMFFKLLKNNDISNHILTDFIKRVLLNFKKLKPTITTFKDGKFLSLDRQPHYNAHGKSNYEDFMRELQC